MPWASLLRGRCRPDGPAGETGPPRDRNARHKAAPVSNTRQQAGKEPNAWNSGQGPARHAVPPHAHAGIQHRTLSFESLHRLRSRRIVNQPGVVVGHLLSQGPSHTEFPEIDLL